LIGAYDSKQKNDWRIYPGMVTVRIGKPVKKEYYQKMSVDELRDVIINKISLLCDDDSIVVSDNQ
ncbi:MAG: hypothetical protein MUP82_08880, partial [Candidatus Marinimicrobia bacterium]|nr:hypothetical protein [Candidatus Neomarinimicrobiota bacterium]